MKSAAAAAQALRVALPPDVHVFASPSTMSLGPSLTVLQLVTDAEAAALRPALADLVADFRQVAGALVEQMWADASPETGIDDDYPETIRYRDATWHLHLHGDRCRFEDEASGEIVEALVDFPDRIDPWFLLIFAQTSGRHGAVVDVCVAGFHDMCRLLDLSAHRFSW